MYKNRFLIVLSTLSLLLVAMVVSLPLSNASKLSAPAGRQADTARWVAMGEYYSQQAEAQRQRSRAADVARWTAMGEHYQNLEVDEAERQRSRAADSARWTAMGEYYSQQAEAQSVERGRVADALRWTAMAEYYAQVDGLSK